MYSTEEQIDRENALTDEQIEQHNLQVEQFELDWEEYNGR